MELNERYQTSSSESLKDLDGDGLVDIIKTESRTFGNKGYLVRQQDFEANPQKFDDADTKLQEMMSGYFQR